MKQVTMYFLLGLYCIPYLVCAQNSVQYRLEVGDSFTIAQSAKQLITQEMEGSKHELTNDLGGILQFTVMGASDKGYDLSLVFKDFSLKTTSNLQGTVIDVKATEVKEGDIMSTMFNAILNHELRVLMGKEGKILSVEGGESMIDKMIASSGIEDDFTIKTMKKGLAKDFSSAGLAQSFEQMTYFYPDAANGVAIGDSWENSYSGKLSANTTFTYDKEDANSTFISGIAAVTMETDEAGTKMSLSGTQETAIQANGKNGFVQKAMVSSEVKGVSSMAHLADVEIPTTIKSTITYELQTD